LILWDLGEHCTAFFIFNTSDYKWNRGSCKFSKGVAPRETHSFGEYCNLMEEVIHYHAITI
jgi:hypothetical protein